MGSKIQHFQAVDEDLGSAAVLSAASPKAPLTLRHHIERFTALQPDHIAILASHLAPLSYRDLQDEMDEIRTRLRQGGFTHSARIGVLLPNGPQAVLAIVAVACAAVAVPLDPRQTPAEFDRLFEALRLDALLVPRGQTPEVQLAAKQRHLTLIEVAFGENGRLSLTLDIPTSAAPARDSEPEPHDPAFILQTSGTTARPKLIPFSHANMLAAAARLQA